MSLWHRRFGDDDVTVLRAAVFALWAVLASRVDVTVWAAFPDGVFTRAGAGVWLVPAAAGVPAATLVAVKWATVAVCVWCAVRRHPGRHVVAAATVAVSTFDTMMKAVGGYPNHGQVVLLWVTVLVAVDAVSRPADAPPGGASSGGSDRWWVGFGAAALLALTYTAVGVRRLVAGGPDVFVDGTVAVWAAARAVSYGELEPGSWLPGDGVWDAAGVWFATRPAGVAVLTVGLLVVTAAEIAAPLALLDTRFRRLWAVTIAGFHLAAFVTMKVPFVENLLLLAVLHTRPAATRLRLRRLRRVAPVD